MYDTDIGFGYGVKVFFRDQLAAAESFDITLFHSTKGERWYRFVFSFPDFELRLGTEYPIALDVTMDYDKYIKAHFHGIGNAARVEDAIVYTKEPIDCSIAVSRSYLATLTGKAGLRWKSVRHGEIQTPDVPAPTERALHVGRVTTTSVFLSIRLDTRDGFVQPMRGWIAEYEMEFIPPVTWNDVSYTRAGLLLQRYLPVLIPGCVLAIRGRVQSLLGGGQLPPQCLLSLGGNSTLRGYPMDRFLDKISLLANAELRIPMYWRFSGILGVDAGNVFAHAGDIGLRRWPWSLVTGLRYSTAAYVVRFDLGFSRESTGIYFNFGHIF